MSFNPTSGATRPPSRTVLVSVSEASVSTGGKVYFSASFKTGLFGKPVKRTFWSDTTGDDTPTWDRASPDDLRPLVGRDLTGEVEVIAVPIETEHFTNEATGEIYEVTSRSIVRFMDETPEQATRRSGSRMRQASVPAVQALAIHGDGHPGNGGQVVAQVA